MNPRTVTRLAVTLLLPTALWAQAPDLIPESAAPAEINQALRGRVAEFLGYHIAKVDRRALDLVAEESKQAYFESGKMNFKAFKITTIEYFSKDFQRALVKADILRDLTIEGQSFEGTSPIATKWKLENGKWVWFLDMEAMWINPVAAAANNPVRTIAETFLETGGKLVKDFDKPESLAAEADKILAQTKLDKKEVTFSINAAGQDRVMLQNGYNGQVDLVLSPPDVPGLKVSLESRTIQPRQNAIVLFEYNPPVGEKPEPGEFTVRLRVEPFAQNFPIKVVFRTK